MIRAVNWPRIVLPALIVLTASVLLPGNSGWRALDWHEILVAQTASEMLQRNEFLVPRIADEARLKKPPLNYWLALAAHRVLGEPGTSHVNEFEARLPSLIAGLLLIVVTYGLGLQLARDARGGLIAAALTASTFSFHTFSRSARPEMLYALLCALMAFGLIWAVRRAMDGRSTVAAAALAWAAFGIALMTKGPQFPLLILLGVVLALWIQKPRLPLLKTLHPWMALIAMILPLAYYGYIALHFDNALSLWRSEMVQGDDVPLWYRPLRFYYPLILFASLAPWLVVLGKMSVDVCKNRERMALILTSCVLVALVLVSFSGKLREHYTLPLVPLCTALMGWSSLRAFDSASDGKARSWRFNLLVWGQFALAGVITVIVIFRHDSSLAESAPGVVVSAALAWLGLAAASYVLAIVMLKRNLSIAFAALVAAILLASGAYPWLGGWQSGFAQSAREFILDMDARLPRERVLYLDQGKHMLHFYHYYGNGDLTALSLDNWQRSKESQPAPYFITSLARIEDSRIEGKIIYQQPSTEADADDIRILFQPGPQN